MSALTRHLLMWFAIAWGMPHAAGALAADPLPEYTVKAGYLYNFALLTEWPDEAIGDSLELCILGPDHFGPALDALRGKTVNNRRIDIRFIVQPSEARKCHILYIAEAERSEMAALRGELANRPVLTVTDDESLSKAGITIFLRPDRQRLVFEINNNAAKRANLNISARLLRLAHAGNEK